MKYLPDLPEVLGYFWHRDVKHPLGRTMRSERIVKIVKDQGTNAEIVFDPDMPLETISLYAYGGEWAGPIPKPDAK